MKKLLLTGILIFFAAAWLCACARSEKEQPPITDPEVLKLLEERALEPFNRQESEKMACFMYANRALVTGDALYCFDYDENWSPVLARYSLGENGLSDFCILADNCVPEYLTVLHDRLFYINTLEGSCIESIGLDGSDRRTVTDYGDFLQTAADRLWFCDEKGRFCSTDTDGGGLIVHIAESCAYPYVIGETIIYQSEKDGERIHLKYREDGADVTVSSGTAYAPVIVDDMLYYTRRGYGGQDLFSLRLDGCVGQRYSTGNIVGTAEFYTEGEIWRARYLTDTDKLRQWTAELSDTESAVETGFRGWRRCDYLGCGWRVESVYNPDGRVNCFMLITPQGEELRYMAGQVG